MSDLIRVKFVSKTDPDENDRLWRPLLPKGSDKIGACQFIFDPEARNYDALIVYEDLPPRQGDQKILRREQLACAQANTMLITTEPASIRIDGPHYLRQFGHIWTRKHPDLVQHPNQIRETPPLRFFYGRNLAGPSHSRIPDQPPRKSENLSTLCSTKAMAHTVHAQRLAFVMALKDRLGDGLSLFGRGIRPIADKAEAMASFRYHIAIENHIEPGHFTEKLVDCFVAGCLPFYYGDPSYSDVFPKHAVIPIDIYDVASSEEIIRTSIARDEFTKRHNALREARKITLERYNTLQAVAHKVERLYDPNANRGGSICGRHGFRRRHPLKAISDTLFSRQARKSPYASPLQITINH